MALVSYPIWISTAAQCPTDLPGGDTAEAWQEVGFLPDTESDLLKVIQQRLGYRSGAPSAKGYLAAYPDQPWVADLLQRHPNLKHGLGGADVERTFWVAVDVTGGASTPKFLITARPARLAALTRRQPSSHPGLRKTTVALPLRLPSLSGQIFRQ